MNISIKEVVFDVEGSPGVKVRFKWWPKSNIHRTEAGWSWYFFATDPKGNDLCGVIEREYHPTYEDALAAFKKQNGEDS